MSNIREIDDILYRYLEGCQHLEQAMEALQANDHLASQQASAAATRDGINALELFLKTYLSHECRARMTEEDRDLFDSKSNFPLLARLMNTYAEPPLYDPTQKALLRYRDIRNAVEHHGSVALPLTEELQEALWTIGWLILEYLPLNERQSQVIEDHLEEIGNLLPEPGTEQGIARIAYQPTRAQEGAETLRTIQEMLEDIRTHLRDAHLPRLIEQDDHIVAEGRHPSAFLRERQISLLERHTLFAGREAELAQIRDFLSGRLHGYIFVTGPSGYGKTALLANLIAPQPDQYLWHFLNQLDGEHTRHRFLRSMVEQLLAYYQMPVCSEADLPETDDRLEALYTKLLRMPLVRADQPLVLAIDGVDEAEDTFVRDIHIPRGLPDGKFVIFSARETGRDYLRELGLPSEDTLTVRLERLHRVGIQMLLREAGGQAAGWAEDLGLLQQVERVSEGDPFYLRYLVEDVATGALSPDQIGQQPAGLRAYLDGWWKQVVEAVRRDQDLRDVMGALMVARGPLPRDDLFRLCPELEWGFDDVLKPVRRFVVISHEDVQPAFALCHHRFRDYLSEHKLRNQVPAYQQRLLDYCAGWQQQHHSRYALRHYAAHLYDAQQWDVLFDLARSDAFAVAQRAQFPDEPHVLLETIQTALRGATDIDNAAAMAEFLLRHVRRLAEIAAKESPLDALQAGSLQRAWELADLYDPERRALWYLLLTWELADSERTDDIGATLARLQEATLPQLSGRQGQQAAYLSARIFEVNSDVYDELRSQLLDQDSHGALCKYLAERGHFVPAMRLAQRIEDDQKRWAALQDISTANSTQVEEFDSALEMVQKLEAEGRKSETLQAIAIAQARSGRFRAALDTAYQLEVGSEWHSETLRDIAIAQAEAGEFEAALETAEMGIVLGVEQGEALCRIAVIQAEVGEYAAALETADRLPGDDWERARTLREIAVIQAQAGEFEAALETVRHLEDVPKPVETSWKRYANFQIGDISLSWEQMDRVMFQLERVTALRNIALAQAQMDEATAAQATFDTALEVVQQIEIKQFQPEALRDIAISQAEAGRLEDAQTTLITALDIGRQIHDVDHRARVFREIALGYAQMGEWERSALLFTRALETAREIGNPSAQAEAFTEIAVAQVKAGLEETARNTFRITLQAVESIEEDSDRNRALKRLIAEAQRIGRPFALELAERIEDVAERTDTLGRVRPRDQAGSIEDGPSQSDLAMTLAISPTDWAQWQAQALRALESQPSDSVSSTETVHNISETSLNRLLELALDFDEPTKSGELAFLGTLEAESGLGERAVRTTELIRVNRENHLPGIANALVNAGDRVNFKQLLFPCAYYPDAAYRMCVLLAQVYPEQAGEIKQAIRDIQT